MTDELDIALEQMRSYARPVEGIARAMAGEYAYTDLDVAPMTKNAIRYTATNDAKKALAWLKSHGFLSDLGIAALKAEEALK